MIRRKKGSKQLCKGKGEEGGNNTSKKWKNPRGKKTEHWLTGVGLGSNVINRSISIILGYFKGEKFLRKTDRRKNSNNGLSAAWWSAVEEVGSWEMKSKFDSFEYSSSRKRVLWFLRVVKKGKKGQLSVGKAGLIRKMAGLFLWEVSYPLENNGKEERSYLGIWSRKEHNSRGRLVTGQANSSWAREKELLPGPAIVK